jgi:hypothetical protein
VIEPEPPVPALLKADGALLRGGDGWIRFLSRVGGDATKDLRFCARNFLLDEGIVSERVDSYIELGGAAEHASVEDWLGSHSAYLAAKVFRPPADGGLPTTIDPSDEALCPETFRFLATTSPFLSTEPRVELIRVESLSFVADYAGMAREKLKDLAVRAVGPDEPKPLRELNDALDAWSRGIEAHPIFAAFLADVKNLVDRNPDRWADALRDAMGLLHLDPGSRHAGTAAGVDILVFKYPVSLVPRRAGDAREQRPLLPPTVLDGRASPAFLPAPGGSLTGHVVDLSGEARSPRREVLHPSIAFQAKHLWKVGTIRQPVERANLAAARGLHLGLVRAVSGREEYARGTDGDLE